MSFGADSSLWYFAKPGSPAEEARFVVQAGSNTAIVMRKNKPCLAHENQLKPCLPVDGNTDSTDLDATLPMFRDGDSGDDAAPVTLMQPSAILQDPIIVNPPTDVSATSVDVPPVDNRVGMFRTSARVNKGVGPTRLGDWHT
jgi:hypothetical protein